MQKYSMCFAMILGLLLLLALPTARAADNVRENEAADVEGLPTEDAAADPAGRPTEQDETAFGGYRGKGPPNEGSAAMAACGYYDSVGVWNRTDVTVLYYIKRTSNNQWRWVRLPPNTWYHHWVQGSTHGQRFQIAYDWDLCSAGSQFTYFYPHYKTLYKCSNPTVKDAYWYHIKRPNACVIGMYAAGEP